ncbi:T9SS type A sorting domain-containing protein [Neolewinella aurantiaca]|uniref:T9SS type A sorting domain-containing protein n=1 Tax=Neolewinella aurantiaca TaxID=2602767 RepID=A0A5C7FLA4_9BACT|nr:LamG-like jellyroll fold domain-containing protein [Neolewinella aurantiaca]TXF91487.1 T9SS type A sorting domain-containing protein [Neolewinella aurantiaca]
MRTIKCLLILLYFVTVGHLFAQDFGAAQLCSTSRTDFLTTNWQPGFGTDQDFSIGFWIRTDGWDGDPAIISNKDWSAGANPGFNIALSPGAGNIDVNVGDGTNRADLDAGNITDGLWHHVLASFDRDGLMTLYLDGIEVESIDISSVGDLNNDHAFNIGMDGTGDYSAGYSSTGPSSEIAEVRIYNTVVSPDQYDVCSGIAAGDALYDNLIHYWKMGEGTGNTAVDAVGNEDATWLNTAAWTTSNSFVEATASFIPEIDRASVTFLNTSVGSSYLWDFGTGETSTLSEPVYTYDELGEYTVQLIVNGPCGSDTITQTVVITELNDSSFNSLNMDGDDQVTLANDLDLDNQPDFTIELYMKSAGWSADPGIISNKDWNSGSNPGFILAGNSNSTSLRFNAGTGNGRIDMNTNAVNDQKWHHIAIAYDADGTKKLYQDGVVVDETDVVLDGSLESDLDLIIGADGTGNYHFTGQVAEVRYWTTVLDSATLADYACGADTDHPAYDHLLHYWKADEGSGTTVLDAAGTNNGTYNGDWTAGPPPAGCEPEVPTNSVGPGNALKMDGIDDWVDCSGNDGQKVSAESIGLPTEAITVECWVKPASYTIWHSVVGFLQDNGNFERGFDLETGDGGQLRFALKSINGSSLTYLSSTSTFAENEWVHLAGVYDGTEQRIYVNGILEGTSTSQSGAIDYADSWLALGAYKDDNEQIVLDGSFDEVRIWEVAKSVEEIRELMCQRLEGDEDDLYAYWPLDRTEGDEVLDAGPNGLHGIFQNTTAAESRIISGAALGDESVTIYPENWDGVNLMLGAEGFGSVNLDNISGDLLSGLHLYRVDTKPDSTDGIYDLGDNGVYYGTFLAGRGGNYSHDLTYDYAGDPAAVTAEATLNLYNRGSNEVPTWFSSGAVRNPGNNSLLLTGAGSRREIVLADFTASPCPAPSNLALIAAGFSSATVSWEADANSYILEYGPAGYLIGTGTTISDVTQTMLEIENLEASNSYDYYVRSSCDGDVKSAWAGPFRFATLDPCGPPTNITTFEVGPTTASIAFDAPETVNQFDLQWGFSNFSLGTGIVVNSDIDTFNLSFLPSSTDFQYYVRSNCEDDFGLQSLWIGPYSFRTESPVSTNSIAGLERFIVSPNPASDHVKVAILTTKVLGTGQLEVRTMTGQLISSRPLNLQGSVSEQFDVSEFPAGLYLISVATKTGRMTQRVTIF